MKIKSVYILALSVLTISHSAFAEDKTVERDPKLQQAAEALFDSVGFKPSPQPDPSKVYSSLEEALDAMIQTYRNSPEFKKALTDDIYNRLSSIKTRTTAVVLGINAVTDEQLTAAATAVAKASRTKNRMAFSTDEAAVEANEVNYLVAQANLKLIEDLRTELIKQKTAEMLADLAEEQDEKNQEPGSSLSERVGKELEAKSKKQSPEEGETVDHFESSRSDDADSSDK